MHGDVLAATRQRQEAGAVSVQCVRVEILRGSDGGAAAGRLNEAEPRLPVPRRPP
jgi:hypothetical protein